MRLLSPIRFLPVIVCAVLLSGSQWLTAQVFSSAQDGAGQAGAGESGPGKPMAMHGQLLLVLPFENHTGDSNLGWISEAVPEILNRRLASAGFMPISREDRLYALDHLDLPQSFQPSRASTIRLAQTLDVDYVVVGSFSTAGSRFSTHAQVLNMDTLHMSPPIEEQDDMKDLLQVLNSLAWRLAKQLDPHFAVAQNTFVAADPTLKVGVFEDYVRGLAAPDSKAKIARLKEAVRLDPHYSPSLFALGRAYFANQDYELAATTFGRLPTDDVNAREADFYRGLACLYTGSYVKAEDSFAFVNKQLPLPEVVNNQGVAASRLGKDATALFLQAAEADPADADYQFNLAVALARKHDLAGALAAIGKALKLRPQDNEAQAFESSLRATTQRSSVKDGSAPSAANRDGAVLAPVSAENEPLERVKRTFNEDAFRQAAFEMEQVEAVRLSSLPPGKHADTLTEDGMRFLYQGLILEAEREFQAALQTDNNNSGAHAGLAMVRERDGDADSARKEAEQSLKLQPNITAYLVLARLDLAQNHLPEAAGNVNHALQMEPQNSIARNLRQQLAAKGQQLP